MDMKTKTIVTAMLLATAYVLLVNLMFLSGFGKDEMVKVGWYSEFGGNSTTTLYPLYVWLNFPYTVCFYFFAIFSFTNNSGYLSISFYYFFLFSYLSVMN